MCGISVKRLECCGYAQWPEIFELFLSVEEFQLLSDDPRDIEGLNDVFQKLSSLGVFNVHIQMRQTMRLAKTQCSTFASVRT